MNSTTALMGELWCLGPALGWRARVAKRPSCLLGSVAAMCPTMRLGNLARHDEDD